MTRTWKGHERHRKDMKGCEGKCFEIKEKAMTINKTNLPKDTQLYLILRNYLPITFGEDIYHFWSSDSDL